MKFNLRPYQKQAIDLVKSEMQKKKNRVILCLPTGAGKTVTFSYLTELAQKKGSKVGVVCHRKELIDQAKSTMESYGLNMSDITFGMVQKYMRNKENIPKMDLCIIDECHIGNFKKFIDVMNEEQPMCKIIGATATPISSSNKNPLRNVFSTVVSPVQIADLIEDNYLSNIIYRKYKIEEDKLEKKGGDFTSESQSRVFSEKNLITELNQINGKTIIFTPSVKQSQHVAEICERLGLKTYQVYHGMHLNVRKKIISDYKKHDINDKSVMVNCSILTAGFDDPKINRVIVYRATTSMTLWLQMVGRGSRVIPKVKSEFVCVDLGGNLDRLGNWEAQRDWKALFELQGRKLKDKEAPTKKCVSCSAIIFASQSICPYCKAIQPIKPKTEIDGELEIIPGMTPIPKHLLKPYDQMTLDELLERRKYGSKISGKPYDMKWVWNQLKIRPNGETLLYNLALRKKYKNPDYFVQMVMSGYN